MYNRRYEKVFLMLRQEVAGYALSKRLPWGSCIMELKNGKGKFHLTAQGLKPLVYSVYLMAGNESIFCGELRPDRKEGCGELKWDFDPDAIGEGRKAEDFHTVLVVAEDGQGGFSAPLTAYFGEKKNWKKDFRPREKTLLPAEENKTEEMQIQAAEAAVALPPRMPVVFEKKEEPPKPAYTEIAPEQSTSYHGSFHGLLAKFRQELENLEETGILTKQETENIRNIGVNPAPIPFEKEEQPAEVTAEITAEQPAEKEKAAEPIPLSVEEEKQGGLFAKNKEMEPFGDGELWKCLFLEELTLLSQVPLKWQKAFFFLLPYRRYHHLILQEEADGIWLGLPSVYQEEDMVDAQSFGFQEFRRVDGDWGYWMCFLEWEG